MPPLIIKKSAKINVSSNFIIADFMLIINYIIFLLIKKVNKGYKSVSRPNLIPVTPTGTIIIIARTPIARIVSP